MENITLRQAQIAERIEVNSGLFARWIAYLDASPKTVQTYTRSIKRFMDYLTEHGITRPEREDVISYREYLKADHKPTTVQAYMAAVKLFFAWTEQEGIYPNISSHVKGCKIDTTEHKKDYLTADQIGRVLSTIDRTELQGKRDYALILLMVTTGLREISVTRANIGDIGIAGGSAVLYYQGKGRTEKADYVKLDTAVERAIRELLQEMAYLHYNCDASDPLFTTVSNHSGSDGRMTTRSISRIIKNRLIAAGFNSERLTGHSLRHTAATLNLLNGGSLEETQQLLGHKDINTTMIYSHALERAKNQSEHRITSAILSAM